MKILNISRLKLTETMREMGVVKLSRKDSETVKICLRKTKYKSKERASTLLSLILKHNVKYVLIEHMNIEMLSFLYLEFEKREIAPIFKVWDKFYTAKGNNFYGDRTPTPKELLNDTPITSGGIVSYVTENDKRFISSTYERYDEAIEG